MLRQANELKNYKLRARDGDIGKVKDLYFNDDTWTVRYLIADTGGWLSGRMVLVSPYALDPPDDSANVIPVDLTRTQIERSPSIDSDRPISRQFERDYYSYYDWPAYWGGPYAWGESPYPARGLAHWSDAMLLPASDDPHLRSMKEVKGYHIEALDGGVGHVEDFVIDDETRAIRYLIVDTRNWWPGKKALVSPAWIERVSWPEQKVFVNLQRAMIKDASMFDSTTLFI